MSRSASVVGAGVVSPAGSSIDDLWTDVAAAAATNAEIVTFEEMPEHPALVCRARGFDPAERLERHEVRRLDRTHQMAMWAADDALLEAGDGPPPERCAVVVGVGVGPAEFNQQQFDNFADRGFRGISPLTIPVVMPNSVAAHLSIRYGFRGPSTTVCTACAAGATAIGEALWLLRTGRADRVLAGGVEAVNVSHVVAPFLRMEAMSSRFDDPGRSSRPFATDRDGFVLGEGAGFLVLERSEESAPGRGRVLGYAATTDAHHIVAPPEGGVGAEQCMRAALDDADLGPAAIDHVNAHGTSTPLNDLAEANAIRSVFERRVPTTATKGVVGHLIGAAGAVEALVTLEALRRRVVPPTANAGDTDEAIEPLIDVVRTPTTVGSSVAISNSFGFGGHNSTLVLAR